MQARSQRLRGGGTTFHFLDASPAQALTQARRAAAGRDIRIGGGPSTVREFLAAGLIDYVHIVVVPIVLGRGERLWDGLEALEDRFRVEAASRPSGPWDSAGTFPVTPSRASISSSVSADHSAIAVNDRAPAMTLPTPCRRRIPTAHTVATPLAIGGRVRHGHWPQCAR